MEVAIIDWKSIDSRFVKDDMYEHINAPKWVDFSCPDENVDDEAWFCRPSCDHPKTVEDFFKAKEKEKERTPLSNSKLQRSASVSDVPPLGDKTKRDATLKKRGTNQPFVVSNNGTKCNRILEDGENQDPNFSTPPNFKAKSWKDAIKSSAEKRQFNDDMMRKEQTPKLKSTMSARNLFSGGDLLNKVAEFCNELKKMATRGRDKEQMEENEEKKEGKDVVDKKLGSRIDEEKERKPLLELNNEKSEVMETPSGSKGKLRRKKRNDDAENTPISMDINNIKRPNVDVLLQIRTCPPTPQGFSAGRGPLKETTPKTFKSRPLNQERGILQEVKHMNKDENRAEPKEKSNNNGGGGGEIAEKEAKTLDVFWFLKPCTLSS